MGVPLTPPPEASRDTEKNRQIKPEENDVPKLAMSPKQREEYELNRHLEFKFMSENPALLNRLYSSGPHHPVTIGADVKPSIGSDRYDFEHLLDDRAGRRGGKEAYNWNAASNNALNAFATAEANRSFENMQRETDINVKEEWIRKRLEFLASDQQKK